MNPWLVLFAVVALALLFVAVPVGAAAFREWRRPWRLVCPRAGMVAQIRVAATSAALAEVFGGRPQIDRCSLWPPLLGCREECLAAPAGARQRMRRGEAPPRQRAEGVIRTIVVPLDGGPGGESVLPAVAELAAASGAGVRLLRVLPPVKEVRDGDDRVVAYVDQESGRMETEARGYLRGVAARLHGVAAEDVVRFGDDVVAEIVEESEAAGADLIAVAAHRHRGLGRALGGGTVRHLRRATTVPLLVVPRTDAVMA
jgi:nucleotide-binding universal stress UspA family protein